MTKGKMRGTIADLTREQYYIVPNFSSLEELRMNRKLWNFLIEEEVLLLVNNECKNLFMPIDMKFETYSKISNIVIEYTKNGFDAMLNIVEDLICRDIAVIINNGISVFRKEIFDKIIKFQHLDINKIEFHIIEDILNVSDIEFVNNISLSFNFIKFFIYSDNLINDLSLEKNCVIFLNKNSFNNKKHSAKEFYVNILFFSEANNYNVYFNRKLAIDNKGDLKNSLHSNHIFGNIFQPKEKIIDIICSSNFQRIWYSKKDITSVCKDCEFRYLCSYKEEPKERSDGTWFHDKECNYNPYICKWSHEDNYFSLEECGIISNYNYFEINMLKLNKIIKNIHS